MMGILTAFTERGWQVTFLSAAADSAHMADLGTLGIHTERIVVNCSSFDTLIGQLAPDVVVFDRFMIEEQFSWRVKQQCPEALRVLNTEDLHSVRHFRQQGLKQESVDIAAVPFDDEMVQREIAAVIRSDIALIISQSELTLLSERFNVNPLQLYFQPLMLPSRSAPGTLMQEREGFAFIGNFRHAPNWDAVRHLKETLWPKIRAVLPTATLHIYGAYPGKKVTNLHNARQGFIVEGWTADARRTLAKHRVLLAPLRFGAGVKGKLITAMQCKTPSITTPIGAEGIADAQQWPGAVVNSDLDFIQQSVTFYNDSQARAHAVDKGDAILKDQFDLSAHQAALVAKVDLLLASKTTHRANLFYQQLLWHQTLRATQFMSQWIEVKNAHR